ncbi:hypothetical protein CTAYLR_004939 [Chrysophaeum taylorii]|uniref:PIH1D1/2/3 CS-like domain-containing protein n=1 Tax=Chrysophaeum taylorii TaxID=2483200 RepID=A0AAD7UQ59_9STRA|nr:hypothetical protein CTAYLR_004939 [Chrysophaeum taylorii]
MVAPDVEKELVRLYREEPGNLDKLERELRDLRTKASATRREASTAALKRGMAEQSKELRRELEKIKKQEAKMRETEEKLQQLADMGDEKSVIEFFEKQGMSRDDLRRALTGDPRGALQGIQMPQVDVDEKAVEFADSLYRVVKGEEEVVEYGPPPPPPKTITQPDFWQREPTQDDPHVVVTIKLPKLDSAKEADLDVAPKHIHFKAPIDYKEAYMLSVPLKRRVRADEATASWKAKRHELQVTIPC